MCQHMTICYDYDSTEEPPIAPPPKIERVYRNTGDKREQRVAQEEELPAEAGLQQVQGRAIKVNTDV